MPRLHRHGRSVTSWDNGFRDLDLNEWLAYHYDYSKLIKLMHPQAGMTFLDIGCGSGEILSSVTEYDLEATGIESKPESAAVSQKNVPQAKIILGSLQEIPFDDNYFDLITCFHVMEFFSNSAGAMREIHRVLKPGGRTCIVLPNAEFIGLRSKEQQYFLEDVDVFYPMETWKKMLNASGLILTDIRYTTQQHMDWHQPASWLDNLRWWFNQIIVKLLPRAYATQFICICQKI